MKKFKKSFTLLLAALICMSMLYGCAGKENGETVNQEQQGQKTEGSIQTQKTEGNAQGEIITIDWMPQNDAPVDKDSPLIKECEKKFNVKFNFIYMDRNKEQELLNIRIASGEVPDVMRLSKDVYRGYVEQGVLAEIPEDLIKKVAPNLYDMTKKNGGDLAWEYGKVNGKLYGIPYLNQNGAYNFTPIWRTDWLKNVGIDKIPETLEEAETAFYKFVNDDPDKNGQKDTYAFSDTAINTILGAFGGIAYGYSNNPSLLGIYWLDKDGKVIPTATMPEMKEGLTLLSKWYKDGLIDPEFIGGENKGQKWSSAVAFWNGRIGFSTPGPFYTVNPPLTPIDGGSVNYREFKKMQKDGAYEAGQPLAGPKGKAGTQSWGTYTGDQIVMGKNVAKDTKKMEKILEINEAMVTDYPFYELVAFGIKGVNYEMDNGEYVYIGDAKDKNFRAKLGISTDGIGYCETNFEFKAKTAVKKYEYADKIGKGPSYVNEVFVGLPSYPQYKAEILKKINENYIMFITGQRNLDEFDKYVDELNNAGLAQLTKEANEWYATYNK